MQPKHTLWPLMLLLAGSWPAAAADDVYVACHLGLSISAADVRDVVLGEKQFLNATRIVPVDNAALQPVFLDKVLKMAAVKYTTTWAKKSFRDGVNPPAVLANDAAVLEFIKRTPGGCGYLSTEPPAAVTVIARY